MWSAGPTTKCVNRGKQRSNSTTRSKPVYCLQNGCNTPQRARIASQRNEQDNRVLDSPQHHCVPRKQPHIAPSFQQAQNDVSGGRPIPDRHGARAFLGNLIFQHGNVTPQLTPNSVALAREHLAQLQGPLEFNPTPAPVCRHRPPEPQQQCLECSERGLPILDVVKKFR
jgi:hypothetical protein